ncbi:iron-containing alcohol dehydrogenase family protein [Conexibacter woesei]|uniref:Iron-containing alcohol dehydrogenase n=1 Tax=Conexibacter woesei (strain DSM 14684 / CCUG 47730 / CIP 108061 / JCM 11494 / NBRC 100937 / ID131577) TaxID=469383 RepID=D3F7T3_CONWI|nr:iron-containing alcohol dehydrogenase [Conexibacter woesei]ADB52827.1 iron-containing alcohol dehydrogenase [Conexibacter woesei DSM 14684]
MRPQIIAPFGNHLPVRIRFGDGVAMELPEVVIGAGASSALVVVDEGLAQVNPAVGEALAALTAAGIEVVHSQKGAGEPRGADVDRAADAVRQTGAGIIVAVGGGSVIDTAKAARLCAQQDLTFAAFLDSEREIPPAEIPLIAMPTTAGTGSEVSGGAVVSDDRSGTKAGIASPNLRAEYALVDPVLTHSVPPAATAFSGIDAIAQAIAGMVARTRTPIGDAIALEAIRLAGRSLVAAYRDGSDAAARSEMACASLLAGLTMNISDCAAEHSLAQAIGTRTGAPHGLTVGLVLAETLERERQFVPEQLERVADALGAPVDGSADGGRAVRAVRELLCELDFPVLGSLAVRSDLDDLTRHAMADFFITQSPRPWSEAEVRTAFEGALAQVGR